MSRKSLFQLVGAGAFSGAATLVIVLAVPSSGVSAEPFLNRPITVISPLGPGTPQDVITRAMAEIVAKNLGQPVIVENRVGAAATLGPAAMAATAKPDGYTVSAVVSTLVLVPLMQKVAYDPFKDFTYILQVASFPLGVTVKSDSPYKSWGDVVAYAKANPGVVTYGTPGAGTNAHLGIELILQHAGVQMTHIPHQGPMPIITAVLGGHVMLQVSGMEWKPYVDDSRMRLLTMLAAKRHPSFPNVPSITELGSPFDIEVPMGFAGPKGMDLAVVRKLHDALKKASEDPAVQALYRKFDINYRYASGEEFRKSLDTTAARMRPVIEKLGLLAKN
jgi:tripartite-type tricarboxylate transporter receptor subunit TctC